MDAEQRIQALAMVVRPLAGELARLLEKFQAVTAGYVGNVESDLAAQAADYKVSTGECGLAGAQVLTKAQFINLVGYMITASATGDGASGSYNTNYHRLLYAQAAGVENLIVK
jgi:hypothetical protein